MEKDHLEIILEDMNGKFDLLLEGHTVLRGQIEQLDRKVEQGDAHSQFLIGALSQRVDAVEESLTRKIDGVEEKLTRRIDEVEGNLTRKIEEVDAKLTQKIEAVEGTLSGKLDGVAADLAAHRRDTEAHDGVYRVKEG